MYNHIYAQLNHVDTRGLHMSKRSSYVTDTQAFKSGKSYLYLMFARF